MKSKTSFPMKCPKCRQTIKSKRSLKNKNSCPHCHWLIIDPPRRKKATRPSGEDYEEESNHFACWIVLMIILVFSIGIAAGYALIFAPDLFDVLFEWIFT